MKNDDGFDDHWQERELLNAVRPVGKGSAPKRRKPGVYLTRKLGLSEQNREYYRLAAMGRRLGKLFSSEEREGAERLLKDHFKMPALKATTIAGFWTAIGAETECRFIIKGDAQYRQALSQTYSVFVRVVTDKDFVGHFNMIVEQEKKIARESGSKKRPRQITSDSDLLRAVVRLTEGFGYLDDESDRRKVWRMAAAIRGLMSIDVAPDGVEKEYQDHGGGIEKWSDLAPKTETLERRRIAADVNAEEMLRKPAISQEDDSYYDDSEPRKEEDDADQETLERDETVSEESGVEPVPYDERFDDIDDESGGQPPRLTQEPWTPKPPRNKQSLIDRGKDLSTYNIWEAHMLNYCVRERKLGPGEGMVIFVAGDSSIPIGARLLRTVNLGFIPQRREEQTDIIKLLVRVIRRLLGPKKGSWAHGAALAANVPPENQ